MAEDEGTRRDEDVEGHEMAAATPEEGQQELRRLFESEQEKDDVDGHRLIVGKPDEGRPDTPSRL